MRLGADPVTGEARRVSRTFKAKTKAAAERQVRAYLAELDAEPTQGSSAPLSMLLEDYLRHSEALGRSPTTIYKNRQIIDRVIVPALGQIQIADLTARHLDEFYRQLLIGPEAISASSVRRYHAIISAALNRAVKWGWLATNVASRATLPEVERPALQVPTLEEIQQLISSLQAEKDLYGMACLIAVSTGLRRGEVCALRWSDYAGGALTVQRSAYKVGKEVGVKSTKSGRVRLVPVIGALATALHQWRARCEAAAANVELSLSPDSYIISDWPDGSRLLNPDTLTAAFRRAAKREGLEHVHFHSLRHFAATELLAAGVSPRDAADVLGHANPSLTLSVYAHSTVERQRAAMEALDRALGA